MSVSHWRRTQSPQRERCDALVIGAGIAGLSAALTFERRGLDVRVIERHTLASGASSRNAGFLMRGCADHYARACERYGRSVAGDLWRLTEQNLAAITAEGAVSLASFRAVPSALLAMDEEQRVELSTSHALLLEDGFASEWASAGDDTPWRSGRVRAALVNPGDAAVNPWELMNLLAGKLRRPIFENQEVCGLEETGGGVLVRSPDREFVAERVMVCTNAYASLLLPDMERLVTPRRGQMISVRYPDGSGVRLDRSYYFNHGSEYCRQTPDGTIVFGGCRTRHADREVGFEDRTTARVQGDIERWVRDLLGPGYQVTARWAGIMGFTPDGLPLVGPTPTFASGRVWFCGGFTGHGMSMGVRTAQLAAEAMLDGNGPPFTLKRFH